MKIRTILLLAFIVMQSYEIKSQTTDSTTLLFSDLKYKQAINHLSRRVKLNKYEKEDILKTLDLHNLACGYSLTKNYPKCIECLEKLIKADTSDNHFYTDQDFYNVSKTKEWRALLIKYNQQRKINAVDTMFVDLAKMAIQDQAYYNEISFYERKYGNNSSNIHRLWKLKDSLNKANLILLEYYIAKGVNLLSRSVSGNIFATKCFLIIQHSTPQKMQTYLPIVKDLYDKKETTGENYALLYDRVSLYKTKGKQTYGSQVNTETNLPYPIIDEKNVDKRRAELGMTSLHEYLLLFSINYNPKK